MLTTLLTAATIAFSAIHGYTVPTDSSPIDNTDSVYLAVTRVGLSPSHRTIPDAFLIMDGRAACHDLALSLPRAQVIQAGLTGYNTSNPTDPMTPAELNWLVASAVTNYCPAFSLATSN